MNQTQGAKPFVWWIVWGSFLSGVIVMYFVLGSKSSALESGPGGSAWLLGALPVVAATILRWTVLPRIPSAATAFPLFIVGIALSEGALFLGLFIFPDHRQTLFLLSLLGLLQFVPYFAHQYPD